MLQKVQLISLHFHPGHQKTLGHDRTSSMATKFRRPVAVQPQWERSASLGDRVAIPDGAEPRLHAVPEIVVYDPKLGHTSQSSSHIRIVSRRGDRVRSLNDDQPRPATVSLRGSLRGQPQRRIFWCCLTCASLAVAARIREAVETGGALRRAAE